MHTDWTGKDKIIFVTKAMIIYVENQKEFIKSLLELINNYSKVAGYKVSIHISIIFFYTSQEQVRFEIIKKILLI